MLALYSYGASVTARQRHAAVFRVYVRYFRRFRCDDAHVILPLPLLCFDIAAAADALFFAASVTPQLPV